MKAKKVQSFYEKAEKNLVAVDCIILGFDSQNLKLLLFKRKVEPFKGEWSLVGSFVKTKENVSEAAARVLYESTGLKGVFLETLGCYGTTDRDPGARVISIVHYSLIRLNDSKEKEVEAYEARWFDVDEIPRLILDHNQMISDALNCFQRNLLFLN